MIDVEGQPFHDAEADAALFEELRKVDGTAWSCVELDMHINDPEFARAMVAQARRVHEPHDGRRGARQAARDHATAAA